MSNEVENIGSMCIILHRERSFHDVDVRVLKSAVQKYARRGMFHPKGLWCLIELDLFSFIENNPKFYRTQKLTEKQIQLNSVKIRSNMINRLIAMMSEDVGPCYFHLPNKIYNLYLKWTKSRRDSSSRKILVELYYCLANENLKRIRLLSDIKTVYNLPAYSTDSDKLHRQLLEKFQMKNIIEILYEDPCQKKTKDQICQLIIEHLSKKSELAFAYLSLLFKRNGEALIGEKIWPYLIRTAASHRDSVQALAFFYKKLTHKEHYLYLYHAMGFIIYEHQIKKIEQKQINFSDMDIDQLYRDHLNVANKIELDSFVFDRHTGAATSRSDFALDGAKVSNESNELFIEKYREMYNEYKVMIDNEEEQNKKKKSTGKRKLNDSMEEKIENKRAKVLNTAEQSIEDQFDVDITRLGYQIDLKNKSFVLDELSKLAHGQPRTGSHKKAVFIAPDFIYKGPYLSSSAADSKKFFHNLYFTRALIALEQHLKLPTHFQSVVDWHSIVKIEDSNEYYLKQKSLGRFSADDNDHEIISTKIESNVKILRRGSHIHRLIELEKDQNFIDEHKQVFQAALEHLYLRYLLNIGDSGTWNILVRRDDCEGICGIDFEELRSANNNRATDPLMIIVSKLSKKQREIYRPYINDLIIFKTKIDVNDELAKTLSTSFKVDVKSLNDRIEAFANCVDKNH